MLSLTSDGCILIVGSKPSNFKRSWLENKRLIFWHSTDGESRFREIPKKVEVVILTRFVRHAFYDRIYNMAKASGIKFFRFVRNTGEIKRLIEDSGILTEGIQPDIDSAALPKVPEVIPEEILIEKSQFEESAFVQQERSIKEVNIKKVNQGALKKFIIENANFSSENPRLEIERIFNLTKESGLQTTLRSVEFAFYRERRRNIKENVSPVSVKKEVIRKSKKVWRKDSVAAIERFLNSVEIVAVAARELKEENDFLREENEKLRKTLLELKDLIRKI